MVNQTINPNHKLMTNSQIQKIKTHSFNPRLKQPFQKIEYTEEQIKEYIKCKEDVVYYANEYFYNTTIDGGLTKITLWDFQVEVLRAMQNERFIIINSSRQIGKSMLYSIYISWYMIFHDYKKVAIIANKAGTVKGILNEKIKVAYEQLPYWLQQAPTVWNVLGFSLENNSTVNVYATTPDTVRSISCNILIIDEAAIIRDSLWNEFAKSSFPVISAGKSSKIFIVSTPKSYNHFYYLVTNAKLKKNNFHAFEFMWDVRPDRDEAWKQGEIALFGEDYFNQEYCCGFIGTSGSLIRGTILKKIIDDATETNYELDITKIRKLKNLNKYFKNIRIFKEPIEDHIYITSLDDATETDEEDNDGACIQILDITSLPFEQVAVADFVDDTSYLEIPYVEVALAKIYNNSWIFNENNDGACREANITIVNEIGYEYIYWKSGEKIAGYRTNTITKSKGCANLKQAVEHGYLKLYDRVTLTQLNQFGKVKESYKAITGSDDNIMSLIGTLHFLQLAQEDIEYIFSDRFYQLPPVADLLKIIHTTVNDSLDENITQKEDGMIEFKNQILNMKEDDRFSLNDLIDTVGSDPATIMRQMERRKNITQTVSGKEYGNKDEALDLVMMGFQEHDTDDEPKRKKTIDDYLFDDE